MRPLAERMRPTTLADFVGQEELVGPNGLIKKAIAQKYIPSLILWGPPGVGKTTLAHIMASELDRPFIALSAIQSGVKEVRQAIKEAESKQFFDSASPILFIDEIHRFSKSQQDALLHAVEVGTVTLIGATTENPSFEVINALLSRCQVYQLHSLDVDHLRNLLQRCLEQDEVLAKRNIKIVEDEALLAYSGGDARKLLNHLELLVNQVAGPDVSITNEFVETNLKKQALAYDKKGDYHYDVISAFIKSIRGSDPNATLYYLARMIEAGEDEKFICRRMIISASEDIGLANPNALLLATSTLHAVQAVGFPEAEIIMSECAIYLATSPKSNSAYLAIKQARDVVRQTGNLPVPMAMRNAPTKLMKQLNYGKGYKYPHDFPGSFVSQSYMPQDIAEIIFYKPKENKAEFRIFERLQKWWQHIYRRS